MAMIVPSAKPSKLVFCSLVMAAIMASMQLAHAKRGCAAFGHSCFGGHGKRTDPIPSGSGAEKEFGAFLPSPSGDFGALLSGDESFRPVGPFGPYRPNGDGSNLVSVRPRRLSPILQNWLANTYGRRYSKEVGK